jgi:hypothetical protein
MPEKETLKRAAEDKAEGKSPSTQAGEFVREEIAKESTAPAQLSRRLQSVYLKRVEQE